MKTISILLGLLLAVPAFAAGQSADGQSLVSELTRDHVDISARYTGDQITLFGAMARPSQVIVKVRSPDESMALEKKGAIGPFWLSKGKHQVDKTPGLYYLLSSAPIETILPKAQRLAHGLDLADALASMQTQPKTTSAEQQQILENAVLRLKQAHGYYVADAHAVRILGERLYSTVIHLPAKLPLGQYRVSIYLVRNGKVVATEHKNILVEQVHLEHWVSSIAADHSWAFGVTFTLGVMLLGLVLGVVLGRGKPRKG